MNNLPKTPPKELLLSMAMRFDHAIGCDGYYDQPLFEGTPSHKQRKEALISQMKQVYEEVSGDGFFDWDSYAVGLIDFEYKHTKNETKKKLMKRKYCGNGFCACSGCFQSVCKIEATREQWEKWKEKHNGTLNKTTQTG